MQRKTRMLGAKNKKIIKIMIATHKAAEMPQNSLMMPVEAGAALHYKHLGFARDDEGDNISVKNKNYSECTVLYWGWKNLKADYVGLFHYRRYFSFAEEKFSVSDDGRKMIHIPIATSKAFAKYGLLDEEKMREIIEQNDIIVAESQKVSDIWTPRKRRRHSVYEHYVDHHEVITNQADLDKMYKVAREKFPELRESIDTYLAGNWYLGYNTCIMRKALYDEMCEFTFGVIFEMEKLVDISHYGQQMARIYGYFAEILTSIFIYHLRRTRPELKVNERQMIFVEKAEPIVPFEPIKNAIPVAFNLRKYTDYSYYTPMLFAPIFAKFLCAMDPMQKYDVFIAHEETEQFYLDELKKMTIQYKNVNLRFINLADERTKISENLRDKIDFRLLAPWILEKYNEIVLLNWNVWINGDITELAKIDLGSKILAAGRDIFQFGQINDMDSRERRRLMEKGVEISDDLFDAAVMCMNLKNFRETKKLEEIILRVESWIPQELTVSDMMNKICKDETVEILPAKWNWRVPTDEPMNYINSLAPVKFFVEYQASVESYVIGQFMEYILFDVLPLNFFVDLWREMEKTSVYSLFLTQVLMKNTKRDKLSIKDKYFPQGSRRREIARRLVPLGSKQRQFLRMFTDRMYR